MVNVFDALPGLEVPVGSISKGLAQMWEETAAKGAPAPASDDVRATQVNFVLHLGFNTTIRDAVEQFGVAVRFSKRAPCRVVVLCPLPMDDPSNEMRAKIYGECHLGKNKGDTRCCEFVLLSYPFSARRYLESQLSVCLITDLPLYYWVHRFASIHRLNDYPYLLRRSDRIIIDSAIADPKFRSFSWPRPGAVHDLAYARLLPVRQSIGQLLSGYSPEKLAADLRTVKLSYGANLEAEAGVLEDWLRPRLAACGNITSTVFTREPLRSGAGGVLNLDFQYSDSRHFQWHGDVDNKSACIAADFGGGRATLHAAVGLLPADAALSDAMFF
jgi:hypothetical protein